MPPKTGLKFYAGRWVQGKAGLTGSEQHGQEKKKPLVFWNHDGLPVKKLEVCGRMENRGNKHEDKGDQVAHIS